MRAQAKVSKSFGCRSGERDSVEPGTTVFIDEAAMGIIKVVSGSGIPSQIEDRVEARAGTPARKTYQVSLLSWELTCHPRGSSGRVDHSDSSSME